MAIVGFEAEGFDMRFMLRLIFIRWKFPCATN
jgi:hypothetical protein